MNRDTQILKYLNPLVIDGLNELNDLCEMHEIEEFVEDDKLAYKLINLAGALRKKHKYLYFEEKVQNINRKDLSWLLNYNFSKTEENTYVFGNPNTGVLVCVRMIQGEVN